jgi:hypothetical protein
MYPARWKHFDKKRQLKWWRLPNEGIGVSHFHELGYAL